MKQNIKTIVTIAFIIWFYYLTYAFYQGLTNTTPDPGDGYDYHFPITYSILDGRFLHPTHFLLPQWYYPGSAELVNAFFIIFHLPLTISNIFAVILLFFCCVKLALHFRLQYHFAFLFGLTIVTLNTIVRWYNDLTLDVLMAIFFLLGILLLEKPQKSLTYAAKLGFILGMLIGSKYTGIYFLVLLILVYWKNIFSVLNINRLLIFLVPFSAFGLFWYIRNYFATGNPFFPFPLFGLPGKNIFQNQNVWNISIAHPITMANAFFSEYNVWSLLIFIALGVYLVKKSKKSISIFGINRLYVLGLAGLFLYFASPTSSQPWIMVSSFRYSWPFFIPLILCAFLLASYYKKKQLLGFITIGSMIMTLTLAYLPKLTLIYLPLALCAQYIIDKYQKKFN